jgi:hypothetical protein
MGFFDTLWRNANATKNAGRIVRSNQRIERAIREQTAKEARMRKEAAEFSRDLNAMLRRKRKRERLLQQLSDKKITREEYHAKLAEIRNEK